MVPFELIRSGSEALSSAVESWTKAGAPGMAPSVIGIHPCWPQSFLNMSGSGWGSNLGLWADFCGKKVVLNRLGKKGWLQEGGPNVKSVKRPMNCGKNSEIGGKQGGKNGGWALKLNGVPLMGDKTTLESGKSLGFLSGDQFGSALEGV